MRFRSTLDLACGVGGAPVVLILVPAELLSEGRPAAAYHGSLRFSARVDFTYVATEFIRI
jgi:hypothetical protein